MNASTDGYLISLFDGSEVRIWLSPERNAKLEVISPGEAKEKCEAEIQLQEGCGYEYRLPGYRLRSSHNIVNPSKLEPGIGRITPGNYVGTISLEILPLKSEQPCGELKLEIQSVKVDYRQHYREMLGYIADRCNELILQANTPVNQLISPVFSGTSASLYQPFAFLRSILETREFSDAIQKIISSPISTWETSFHQRDIRNIKRFDQSMVRQICSSSRRDPLPASHPLRLSMTSIPARVKSEQKIRTLDTPENRFIKHALTTFQAICNVVMERAVSMPRLRSEATALERKLYQWLSNSLFKEVSQPHSIPLNSPVLQRKEGYREVFRVWLMHDLASRITWAGGEDVYSGEKKDVATLYEYWVFFRLLDIVKEVFKVKPEAIMELISVSENGLNLHLKQGNQLAIKDIYDEGDRRLNLEFSYNRTFSGQQEYPSEGSWTKSFRPDYTLSVWPDGISPGKAELEETIIHIHFDAKYRVKELKEIIGDEELEDKSSTTAPEDLDLLKMHAYRDAIRRTGGAYVIYPGKDPLERRGFHEIIPGLGAFTLNPGFDQKDAEAIKTFLRDVAGHLRDRATQREKYALKKYQVFKDKQTQSVFAPMPVLTGEFRDQVPDETYVLVAWYNGFEHLKWIEKNCIYNTRTSLGRGSIHIAPELTGVKYILLHGRGETTTGRIYALYDRGPTIWSDTDLIKRNYPGKPSVPFYLVFNLKNNQPVEEFAELKWDISKLGEYTAYRGSPLPFVVSMTELMQVRMTADRS